MTENTAPAATPAVWTVDALDRFIHNADDPRSVKGNSPFPSRTEIEQGLDGDNPMAAREREIRAAKRARRARR